MSNKKCVDKKYMLFLKGSTAFMCGNAKRQQNDRRQKKKFNAFDEQKKNTNFCLFL